MLKKALRMLFEDFEAQIKWQNEVDEGSSSESQEEPLVEEQAADPLISFASILSPQEYEDALNPTKEPQLYLRDDWIQPVEVMQKPKELQAKDKARARVAKNCLIVTLMSLNVGYGSLVERYQNEGSSAPPELNAVILTDEEVLTYKDESDARCDQVPATPAGMPPSTVLARHLTEVSVNNAEIAVVRDANLKINHVMSVKQTLREDPEYSYQFSCRAADWSRSAFYSVPMQFETLELHVVDPLEQQEVPDHFQQPAKAITEDVSVMRGPQALEWMQAVRDEIEAFKRLGVYEEVPRKDATSTPLPARLILVTKPNVHGGPARKKAKIVTCGNFQEVHPDEFTASKTASYPSLRMALSVASHTGWPIECWDVSTAFLYARLFGDRDTDLGGNEIFRRPPKILVETKVVDCYTVTDHLVFGRWFPSDQERTQVLRLLRRSSLGVW